LVLIDIKVLRRERLWAIIGLRGTVKTKKGDKEKLRVKILEKAMPYFKIHGSGGSGIADLMKYIGLTTGALYSHFESKDELFAEAVYYELEKLEFTLFQIFRSEGKHALQAMIEAYFAEETFLEIGDGCVFTSLSTDMQRAAPAYRKRFEDYTVRLYQLFADGIRQQFPQLSPEEAYEKGVYLYSGLVGTMSMARTMSDLKLSHQILAAGRKELIERFVAPENQTRSKTTAVVEAM
jgi:TetR/AcrR family transcriptional repressor of nem operon